VERFTPRPLYRKKRDPGTHRTGGWVGSISVMDAMVKRNTPNPHLESKPRTAIVQLLAQSYTDRAITVIQGYISRPKFKDNIIFK